MGGWAEGRGEERREGLFGLGAVMEGVTGPQSGHGPKGQRPIHVKVAGAVRACECGEGGVDDCPPPQKKEAYLKAGVEKERSTKLVILQIRPVTSSLCPVPSGYVRTWPRPAGHTHTQRGKTYRHECKP